MSSRMRVVGRSTPCSSGIALTSAAELANVIASAAKGSTDDALNSTTPSDGPTN